MNGKKTSDRLLFTMVTATPDNDTWLGQEYKHDSAKAF